MILEEIKNIKSEKKDLRDFGITFGVLCAILAGTLLYKEKDSYVIFAMLSAAFFLFGLALPRLLTPLQKAWMTFAVIMGWFMTRLLLSVLFYAIFTSIGGIARLFGKKFLDLKGDRSKKSYWIDREQVPFDRERYEKQF